MKKLIALFGSLLLLAGAKAQKNHQPVKKETVKPTNGNAPKPDAADNFLKLGTPGDAHKNANPAFLKGAQPALKNSSPAASRQIAPQRALSPGNKQSAPVRKAPKH